MSQTISLRTMILVGVCLQNAGYTLIRKYSTMTENVSSKEILLIGEIIKMYVPPPITTANAVTIALSSSIIVSFS